MRRIKNAPRTKTSPLFNLLSAVLAFLLWGGWAFIVNGKLSSTAGYTAALTQGTASAVITLFMVRMVTWLYIILPETFFRMILPGFLTVCFTGGCLIGIHYLAGTPEIFYTVSPALTVAFLFNVFTTFKLIRQDRLSEETDSE